MNFNSHNFASQCGAFIQRILSLQVRKLRFRRPRPKLIDIDNPDGDLQGSPVELNVAGACSNI